MLLPTSFTKVPFVPSSWEKVHKMVEIAKPLPRQKMADLGSGDGRLLIEFAKKGVEAHGYEVDGELILKAKAKITEENLESKIFLHWKDYWNEDLSSYNIITMYTLGSLMAKFEEKLRKELKPGSKIVSNIFTFPNWKPIKTENDVYLYLV